MRAPNYALRNGARIAAAVNYLQATAEHLSRFLNVRVRHTQSHATANDRYFSWNRRRKCFPRGFLQVPKLRAGTNARWAELADTVCCVDQRRFAD